MSAGLESSLLLGTKSCTLLANSLARFGSRFLGTHSRLLSNNLLPCRRTLGSFLPSIHFGSLLRGFRCNLPQTLLLLGLEFLGSSLGNVSDAAFLLLRHLEAACPLPSSRSTSYKYSCITHLLQSPVQRSGLLCCIHIELAAEVVLDGAQGRP